MSENPRAKKRGASSPNTRKSKVRTRQKNPKIRRTSSKKSRNARKTNSKKNATKTRKSPRQIYLGLNRAKLRKKANYVLLANIKFQKLQRYVNQQNNPSSAPQKPLANSAAYL